MTFSPDCHAFGNGAGMAVPGKRTLERKAMRVSSTIAKNHEGRGVVLILNTLLCCGCLNDITALTPIFKHSLFIFL